MREAKYQWVFPEIPKDKETEIAAVLKKMELPTTWLPFFWNRGLLTEEAIRHFTDCNQDQLHDPFLLYDMERAVERIQTALLNDECILIYGDYDADGLTSTSVMKEVFDLLGARVITYIPNRFLDGYGPNSATYQRLITEYGVNLIITVDNGVAGHQAIKHAQELGVDVIVTDHHELPEKLPTAYAIIHPRHPKGHYPFGELAGVGVAFKLATALLEEVPTELLDLVAIGTIADVVPLVAENRTLVKLGLSRCHATDRTGLLCLAKEAELDLACLTSEQISFGIAPRLNALGRMGNANSGVTLLTSQDMGECRQLAEQLEVLNRERQDTVATIMDEALTLITPHSPCNIIAKENWHEGVLGIVASRLVEVTGRPTIVLNIDPTTGIAKGSGRSIPQVNLFETLQVAADLFVGFGGHHMAAGMSIPSENLPQLTQLLTAELEKQVIDFNEKTKLMIDFTPTLAEISLAELEKQKVLEPFGSANPSPIYCYQGVKSCQLKQLGSDKQHLKFQVKDQEASLDVIAFGFGSEAYEFQQEPEVAVVGQLSVNQWNGHKKAQLQLQDYQIKTRQLYDMRGKKVSALPDSVLENGRLVYFDAGWQELAEKSSSHSWLFRRTEIPLISGSDDLILFDCPLDLADLVALLQQSKATRIWCFFIVEVDHYLEGIPSREEFARVYKCIQANQTIDIRHKLDQLAHYLHLPQKRLLFILQVFHELAFVTIKDGLLTGVSQPKHQELSASSRYQQQLKQIEIEKFLRYSTIDSLKQWLRKEEEKK